MAPVLDATLGGETSNSYVTLAQAEAIAENVLGGDEWTALDVNTKTFSLIGATSWLETLKYAGSACSDLQRLSWPRTGYDCQARPFSCSSIPFKIQEAEVLLAMQLAKNPNSIIGGGGGNNAPAGTYTKRQKLGDLEIEYAQFNANVATSCDDCDKNPILAQYPWLEAILDCFLNMPAPGAGRIIGRVRS